MRLVRPISFFFLLPGFALAAACAHPVNPFTTNNFSTTACFDNCGNDTSCQASCRQVGAPGTPSPPTFQQGVPAR